jgi:SAM-dependent methyltransferase
MSGGVRGVVRRLWPAPSKGPDREYFESWDSRSDDPWGHLASDYERARYEWTLAALGGRHVGRALEVGCSLGMFTEMLAAHCDSVLGVDISEVSVTRARERLAGLDDVTFERRTLPAEMPAGPFDLIVCADVLVYWTADELRDALRAMEAQLAPGGALLLVHYRPKVRIQPLRGDEAHDIVAGATRLAHAGHDERGDHRLDLFEDRA